MEEKKMKYIRTKDAITTDKLYEQALEICALTYENAQKSDLKIINQSDTIEELCDRLVVIHKYGEQPKDMSFYEAHYFIDVWTRKVKSNDPIVAIYGAIWTNKGLIYVAKMNEKGELELL